MSSNAQPSLERVRPLRRGSVAVVRGARGLLRVCLLLVLLCVILVAVITASARIGLPFLAAYKPSLESRLSEYLESPVTIAELDARWAGTGPILRARGVQLTDPLGRQAQFDELLMDLNVPRSLLAGAAVMDELTLVGADLAMDYDRKNGISIHGVNRERGITPSVVETSAANGSRNEGFNAVAWLLTAARVGMLDTQLSLQMPDDSTLIIDNLNIRAENRGDLHQVRMDMSLPQMLGDEFEIGADIIGKANNLTAARGNFYIKAADFKAGGVHHLLEAYDLSVPMLEALSQRGTNVQAEVWGELKDGRVQRVNGRTAIAQSAENDPAVDSLFGDLFWARQDDEGWQFAATDVVVGRRGAEAVFDEIRMGASDNQSVKPQWVSLKTAETDLQPVINTVTTLLPSAIPEPVEQWLASASPSAKIRQADVRLSLVNPASSFSVTAEFDDSQWLPSGRRPGAKIANFRVDIVDGRGQIQLPAQTLEIRPPSTGVRGDLATDEPSTPKPLVIQQMAWNAQVDLPKSKITGDITLQHHSANIALRHQIGLQDITAPKFDVQGQFAAGSALDLKPWFTQAWMPPGARRWLDNAIQDGKVTDGKVQVLGSFEQLRQQLKNNDTANGDDSEAESHVAVAVANDSVLRVAFEVEDATLEFLPSWPAATAVKASVVFDRNSLTSTVRSGSLSGLPITKASATIEDLFNPELQMSMTSSTALKTLVNFGTTGPAPLRRVLTPVLGGASVDGPARLEMDLRTPLRRSGGNAVASNQPWPVSVKGQVFLKNSSIKLAAVDLPLENVRGPIGFTEDGIELKSVRATLFGSNVRLNAASTGSGVNRRTDVAVRTVMPGKQLLERFELPVAEFVSGSSNWRADASIPHNAAKLAKNGIALTITSDLVGTAVSLAEPLGKTSGAKLPLRVSTRFFDESSSKPQTWRLRFGDANAPKNDIRVTVANNTMQGLLMSLGESLGDQQPDEGIRVSGVADVMSLDGLVTDIAAVIDALPDTGGDPTKILPVSVDVYARQLIAGRSRMGDASIKVNTDDQFINMFINNTHLRGSLRYPREHWRKDIVAKARINFADRVLIDALSSETEESTESASRLDPRTLPPVDLHVSRFDWDKLTLNNLVIRTEPDLAGLRVRTFGFATGTTQLIGEGLWHLVDPQNVNANLANAHTAQLHLTLRSSDLGTALSQLGFNGVMANGEGQVTASLNWPDAFYAPGLDTVAARAELDIKRGRLLQIEPGAARLAGLFALQTLPRRLSFDFNDIVRDGLDFATITGDVALESGVADMRLVQLNGPVGVIDFTGTSSLITQQFDQKITVLPRVSAALPIIGIISGGASAGVGALIAGGVLKAVGVDFDRIGLREYSLTGTWNEPKFAPLKR